jgi:hypothetical protein
MLGLSLSFGIWIKDAGWSRGCDTPDTDRVYPELVEGLRFGVRHGREIRRVKGKSVIRFNRKSVPKIRRVF